MNKITALVKYGNKAADKGERGDFAADAHPYTVTLRYKGRRMTVNFWCGSGWTREPNAADVLECVISDSVSFSDDGGGSFEEWCSDLGMDTGSRKAERTYRQCERQAEALKRFLLDDFCGALGGGEDWIKAHTVTA